ncbi:MAG TPA: hypothetical protein VGO53_16460 [Steroidobacteraceae bacterium]|jgi:hypothetical protein|nr:hypothetical protein [Steroidobacteraceae bacterium]
MRVVVITGSREWTERLPISIVVALADLVIHGGARGADTLAERAAAQLQIDTLTLRAKWTKAANPAKVDKWAGFERNERMAKHAAELSAMGDDVQCFAFPLGESRGTRDCIARMRKHGVKTTVYGEAS